MECASAMIIGQDRPVVSALTTIMVEIVSHFVTAVLLVQIWETVMLLANAFAMAIEIPQMVVLRAAIIFTEMTVVSIATQRRVVTAFATQRTEAVNVHSI